MSEDKLLPLEQMPAWLRDAVKEIAARWIKTGGDSVDWPSLYEHMGAAILRHLPKQRILGVCCDCHYGGEDETPCAAREDGTHCVHWWEGPSAPRAPDEAALLPPAPDAGLLREAALASQDARQIADWPALSTLPPLAVLDEMRRIARRAASRLDAAVLRAAASRPGAPASPAEEGA